MKMKSLNFANEALGIAEYKLKSLHLYSISVYVSTVVDILLYHLLNVRGGGQSL